MSKQENMDAVYTVTKREVGMPLLDFLARRRGISKRLGKRMLDARQVMVNRNHVWMAHHRLKTGDAVEIVGSLPMGRQAVDCLFEDEDYILVDKPSGMLSTGDASLETRLRARRREPNLRSVHRLDRDTSGCLLLARSPRAFDAAVALWKEDAVRKIYRAIVLGYVAADTRTLTTPVDGQRAVSRLRVLDANREASHLAVTIETGRTHQIRKHLSGMGHAVIGDRHYMTTHRDTDKSLGVGRHMLHASELAFPHPFAGGPVRVRAPLPADFRRCLKLFRLT